MATLRASIRKVRMINGQVNKRTTIWSLWTAKIAQTRQTRSADARVTRCYAIQCKVLHLRLPGPSIFDVSTTYETSKRFRTQHNLVAVLHSHSASTKVQFQECKFRFYGMSKQLGTVSDDNYLTISLYKSIIYLLNKTLFKNLHLFRLFVCLFFLMFLSGLFIEVSSISNNRKLIDGYLFKLN
jgi:hypothetical protein